jgi:hypothetical protein
LKIFENSKELEKEILTKLKQEGIRLLSGQDEKEIRTQLFGKPNVL